MKKIFLFFVNSCILLFITFSNVYCATLPEDGKKIIEKYINKKTTLSFDYKVEGEKINISSFKLYNRGGYFFNEDANDIYQYMINNDLENISKYNSKYEHWTIKLGKYRIVSIDKVLMENRGEYSIYKVAFKYFPEFIFGNFEDINLVNKLIDKYNFKGFGTLVYDNFKEEWIVKEDLTDLWSIAGDQNYNLLELKGDNFIAFLELASEIAKKNNPCSKSISDQRNIRTILKKYYITNNIFPKDISKNTLGEYYTSLPSDGIDILYTSDGNNYEIKTKYKGCKNIYFSNSDSDEINILSSIAESSGSQNKVNGSEYKQENSHVLEGGWQGTAFVGNTSWEIKMNISEKESSIDYPSLGCGGMLSLIVSSNNKITFSEKLTYGISKCINNGKVIITKSGDNQANYQWQYPNGQIGANGILTRR